MSASPNGANGSGSGSPTGLILDSEDPGQSLPLIGKAQRFHQPWHEGETPSVSIGQGYDLATPLQMVRVAAALSNGGIIYVPTVVEKIVNPDGEVAHQFQPTIASRLNASPKTLEAVRRACGGVVREGTGKAARLWFVDVGGKTGTSQVVSLRKEAKGRTGAKPRITPGSSVLPRWRTLRLPLPLLSSTAAMGAPWRHRWPES